jgi:hypothetical protein
MLRRELVWVVLDFEPDRHDCARTELGTDNPPSAIRN